MKIGSENLIRARRCAQPIQHLAGNRRVVLLIHGYTGYPGELAFIGKELAEADWDVRIPRLTGHGTSGSDFASANMAMWRRQVADEWFNLNTIYDEVMVLGHSMGALLSLDLAVKYPVRSLVVLAPAIGVRVKGRSLFRVISWFIRKWPREWESDPDFCFFDERDEDDDLYLGAEYWSWNWFSSLADLFSLQSAIERRLGSVKAPVLGIFGELDELVGSASRKLMKTRLKSAYIEKILTGCGHLIPYDPNTGSKELAAQTIIEWLESQSTRKPGVC